jgi:hypothetical protein
MMMMMMIVEQSVEYELTGQPKYSEKACHFGHYKTHMT